MTRVRRATGARDAVTEVVTALATDRNATPAQLTAAVLATVRRVVGADAAALYAHNTSGAGMSTALFLDPQLLWTQVPYRAAPTALAVRLHPGVRHLLQTRTRAPFAVTDLVSERAWLGSQLGSEMRPSWGRNHQLVVPVDDHGEPVRHAWVLGRFSTEFHPAERDVVDAVQPVLVALSRHLRVVAGRELADDGVLTPRERVVASLLVEGHSATAVARLLAISPRTVQKHTERIYLKLGVHDRAELRGRIGPSAG